MIWLMVGIFLSSASVATKLRLDILVGIFLKKSSGGQAWPFLKNVPGQSKFKPASSSARFFFEGCGLKM
jgi:hypothetical protein